MFITPSPFSVLLGAQTFLFSLGLFAIAISLDLPSLTLSFSLFLPLRFRVFLSLFRKKCLGRLLTTAIGNVSGGFLGTFSQDCPWRFSPCARINVWEGHSRSPDPRAFLARILILLQQALLPPLLWGSIILQVCPLQAALPPPPPASLPCSFAFQGTQVLCLISFLLFFLAV